MCRAGGTCPCGRCLCARRAYLSVILFAQRQHAHPCVFEQAELPALFPGLCRSLLFDERPEQAELVFAGAAFVPGKPDLPVVVFAQRPHAHPRVFEQAELPALFPGLHRFLLFDERPEQAELVFARTAFVPGEPDFTEIVFAQRYHPHPRVFQ